MKAVILLLQLQMSPTVTLYQLYQTIAQLFLQLGSSLGASDAETLSRIRWELDTAYVVSQTLLLTQLTAYWLVSVRLLRSVAWRVMHKLLPVRFRQGMRSAWAHRLSKILLLVCPSQLLHTR